MGAHVSVPMYQRSIPQRYRLVALKCKKCGHVNFPPKGVCIGCRVGREFTPVRLTGDGAVVTFTRVSRGGAPPEFSEQVQAKEYYWVAIVALDEGPCVISQLVDVPDPGPSCGMRVAAAFRKIYDEEGVIRYGYKFRPAGDAHAPDDGLRCAGR